MRMYGTDKDEDEIPTRCIVEVTRNRKFIQCPFKRGHGEKGLYCSEHAKGIEEGKSYYVPRIKK